MLLVVRSRLWLSAGESVRSSCFLIDQNFNSSESFRNSICLSRCSKLTTYFSTSDKISRGASSQKIVSLYNLEFSHNAASSSSLSPNKLTLLFHAWSVTTSSSTPFN